MEGRVFGLRPDPPDERDLRYRRDYLRMSRLGQKLRALVLPKSVDLRNEPAPSVYDQGNIGSCVDNALATVIGHITADQGEGVFYGSRLLNPK